MFKINSPLLTGMLIIIAFSACQRVIDVNIKSVGKQLVIEGNITNVAGLQTVSISNTVPYSNSNVYPAVSGASVFISTAEGFVYSLKEASAGQYTVNAVRGKPGGVYTLNVLTNGQTYTATSIMPVPVNLDSLGLSAINYGNKIIKTVICYYHDPRGMQNQYRFIMYVNGVQIKQIFPLNDAGADGLNITTMLYQSDIDLLKGDKIDIEMQCIDAAMYNYWLNLSQQGGNGPSNSATPSNPVSNLSNGALGYFSAHTTQRKSIVIP